MHLRGPGFFLLLLIFPPANAGGVDLHTLWDDRCAECHGHSAQFARKFLKLGGGELQGRHHERNLRQFLSHHYPPDREVDAIYLMLMAQVSTAPRFIDECGKCHGSAAAFVRGSISLRDGELVLQKSGDSLRQFLQSHRNLTQDDTHFFMRQFTRLAHEIFRP
ncbi:MAG: hypothetical protein GY802_24015 [Gammaproteobacteria bacterium]|nr:hypothetical protein [Gammaproteobacteria bacterium]